MSDNYAKKGNEMDLVGSHQRLLIGAALRTTGPMLELGVGWYSTPLLHEIAVTQDRYLRTLDNNKHWLEQFRASEWTDDYGLVHGNHDLKLVGWWGDADFDPPHANCWGLVFVDHAQACEREYAIRRLLDKTDVFVMHDTEDGFPYGYDRVLPMFKWQWTDRCQKSFTTVASNVVDVSDWFKFNQLPPVEPTLEVT